MKTKLILVGSGSFGREVINWSYDIFDDAADGFRAYLGSPDAFKDYRYDLQCLGAIEDYLPQANDRFVIAVGDPETKKMLVEQLLAKGAKFATLVHPSAVIARTAVLEEGVVICPQAVISADCRICRFAAVNVLSSVGHDAFVGEYSTLSGHVDLTGFVHVGELVFFGTGAKVLPKVRIGSKSRIGAGSVIMRNVADGSVMYTMPAKKL
jgi:sugar O-acyltransferase (sialic acid O-acetyltransferase NeuD family)